MPETDPIPLFPLGEYPQSREALLPDILPRLSFISSEEVITEMEKAYRMGRNYKGMELQFRHITRFPEEINDYVIGEIGTLKAELIQDYGEDTIAKVRSGEMPIPDDDHFIQTFQRIRAYSEYLALGNWRLIPIVFSRLPYSREYSEADMQDFFQEGFVAMVNAAERADLKKGTWRNFVYPYVKGKIQSCRDERVYQGFTKSELAKYRYYYRVRDTSQKLYEVLPEEMKKTMMEVRGGDPGSYHGIYDEDFFSVDQGLTNEAFMMSVILSTMHFEYKRKTKNSASLVDDIQTYVTELESNNRKWEFFRHHVKTYQTLIKIVAPTLSLDEPNIKTIKDSEGEKITFNGMYDVVDDLNSDPEEGIEIADELAMVGKILLEDPSLTDLQRLVIQLRYGFTEQGELHRKEIVEAVNENEYVVANALHRGLKKLRKTVEEMESE